MKKQSSNYTSGTRMYLNLNPITLNIKWRKPTPKNNFNLKKASLLFWEYLGTKRGILQYLASIYDLLGLSSPVLLVGKMIYRDVCEMKVAWDKPLEGQNLQRWDKWRSNLQKFKNLQRYHDQFHATENQFKELISMVLVMQAKMVHQQLFTL